ncbi:MAG: hypothetical protein SGBAC_008372 [Bacillariaceae sp.]
MLRTNKQYKAYNRGNYPMPANRGVPKPQPSSKKQLTFGRIVYWICMALISKRILDNMVFLVTLPSKPAVSSSSSTAAALPPPPPPPAITTALRTPSTPQSSPVVTAPKPVKVQPVAPQQIQQQQKAEAARDLKNQDEKESEGDEDSDDDDDDEAEKKEDEPPAFDPANWMVEFAAPSKDESTERKICFITCSYATSASDMDPLVLIKNRNPKYVRFFLFSNLNDEEWHTPGWTKIVTHYNYTRVITHSRYGKFMGWKYSEIRDNCEAVFYMDSVLRPSSNKTYWDEIATYMLNDNYEQVMAHKNSISDEEIKNTITNNATHTGNLTKYLINATGFMQHTHPRNRTGIYNEIQAIQWAKKDFKKNVKALMNWFRKQPEGFDHFTPVYLCQSFGYNPNSKVFQMIAESFWEHYSLEIDSWRDQPLWSFMLRRYLVRPTIFPYPQEALWKELELENFGHGNHEYQSEADVKM